MKIAIHITVDIDAKVWALEYGLQPHEVRDDVRVWAHGQILEELSDRGLLL